MCSLPLPSLPSPTGMVSGPARGSTVTAEEPMRTVVTTATVCMEVALGGVHSVVQCQMTRAHCYTVTQNSFKAFPQILCALPTLPNVF